MITILFLQLSLSIYMYYKTFTKYILLCDLIKDFYIQYITSFNYNLYETDIDDIYILKDDIESIILKKNNINFMKDILVLYVKQIYNNNQENIQQIELSIYSNLNNARFDGHIQQNSYSAAIKSFTKISNQVNKFNNIKLFIDNIDYKQILYIIYISYIYSYFTNSPIFTTIYIITSQYVFYKFIYFINIINNIDQIFDKKRYIDNISKKLDKIKNSYISNIDHIELMCKEYEQL